MLAVKLEETDYVAANAPHQRASRRLTALVWLVMLGLTLTAARLWSLAAVASPAGRLLACFAAVLRGSSAGPWPHWVCGRFTSPGRPWGRAGEC